MLQGRLCLHVTDHISQKLVGKTEYIFIRNWFEISFERFTCKFYQTLPTRYDVNVYKPKHILYILEKFQNDYYFVAIELCVMQFWSEMVIEIPHSHYTIIVHFWITWLSDQIALH